MSRPAFTTRRGILTSSVEDRDFVAGGDPQDAGEVVDTPRRQHRPRPSLDRASTRGNSAHHGEIIVILILAAVTSAVTVTISLPHQLSRSALLFKCRPRQYRFSPLSSGGFACYLAQDPGSIQGRNQGPHRQDWIS